MYPKGRQEIKTLASKGTQQMKDPCVGAMAASTDRKSTRLNSSHSGQSRMPSSA